MKRCSILLIIREMQIKTKNEMLSHTCQNAYHQKEHNKCCWGCGWWWECKLVQPLRETGWRFLQTVKIELPYDPAIPLLGTYLTKTKTLFWKDTCTVMFKVVLLTIAMIWKQPKCPSTGESIKMWHTHTHTLEYYSAIKKNEILPFATTWMDLEGIMLSKTTQRRQIRYDITYIWSLKNKTKEWT